VTGLKEGARVEMAGVPIGEVEAIVLDTEQQVARVQIKIQGNVTLSDDTIASVKTAGLIGDKYIRLSPGGSDLVLKAGDTIYETESAVDIEELISKYVFGGV
jgi:phospholipid/cholesterol/gamma-HCH transport system substrate-binding protein